MGLFGRNPNEAAYVGGKKHFAEVIKNSGAGDLLIWRQPEEDFNTRSTLIVMPGEMAVFVNGGTVEEVFENGTYKLDTQNYPFISRLRNAATGGISAFHCVVYFVRTAHSQEMFWGTETPIQARDKMWGVRTDIRARGSYKLHVDNPVMFLQKLIGNNIRFETQEGMNDYFVHEFQSKIKSVISGQINQMESELIGLDARLDEFSQAIEPALDEILSEYGLKCDNFNVSALDVDKSKYESIDEAQVEATRRSILAKGDAAAMNALGANWEKQQAVNIITNLSNNPNAGAIGTMGAGLGMGMMAGGIFGGMAGQVMQPMSQDAVKKTEEDPMEALTKLKRLLDAGLIEQSEYDTKKAEVLSRI
ncbi:MAG: SPFH domain-containing protein [Lachnospiraceae bacterium]|nr:SPFH domain-containing protein [Lachnospiraceae bacterium]